MVVVQHLRVPPWDLGSVGRQGLVLAQGKARHGTSLGAHLGYTNWAALRSPAKSLTFGGLNGNYH